MKRLALLLLPVLAVLLMSHNAGAVGRIGAYSDYETNSNVQGSLNLNTRYTFNWTNKTSVYLRKGHFRNSFDWYKDNIYHLVLTFNFYGDSFNVAGNEAIRFESPYYTTENDEVASSFSCETECRYTIIHNITLRGTSNGNYYLAVPESNLISLFGVNATDGVEFMWTGTLFYDDDEWSAVKDDISSIHSDTTDIVNTLDDINDKLNSLDTNADKNAEAWDNMQDTDGLIDVGDNTSFMDSFNALNGFFGGLKNKTADDCVVNADFEGRLNMGDINLCSMPDNIKGIIGTISGVVFAVFDLFLVWNSIHYVVGLIDWSRRN